MIESVFPCLSTITNHFLWLSFFQVSLNLEFGVSSLNKPSWHPYLVTSWQENVLLAFKVIGFISPTYWQWTGGDCSQSSLILLCILYSIFYSILWIRMSPVAIIATLLSLIPGCRESVLYEAISQCKEPGFLSLSLALRSFLLVFLLFSISRWDSDSGSDRSRWDINSILCLTLSLSLSLLILLCWVQLLLQSATHNHCPAYDFSKFLMNLKTLSELPVLISAIFVLIFQYEIWGWLVDHSAQPSPKTQKLKPGS